MVDHRIRSNGEKQVPPTPPTSKEKGLQLYRKLKTVRAFEEKVDKLFTQGKVPGTIHTSVGQEAVAVGRGRGR